MNICIPVKEDKGLSSEVNPHFGSAPIFLIVDTESGAARVIPNRNEHHAHGMCQPLASLAGERIDAIVVGGIGMGALSKMQAAGLEVFLSDIASVNETISAWKSGTLRPMTPAMACGHHGQGPGSAAGGHHGPGAGGGCRGQGPQAYRT
jgi:predicted Fe-Mo cluster-binding NifX family protein